LPVGSMVIAHLVRERSRPMRLPHVLPPHGVGPLKDPHAAGHPLRPGHSFASEDYLALGSHPAIRRAALSGLGQHPHPEDPEPTRDLSARLAAFLKLPEACTFASGAEAIHHTLRQFLLPGDSVILDCGASRTMADAILAAGASLHRTPAASVDGVARRLARLSRQPRRGRLIVAVPAISSHASRLADLAELTSLTRSYGALLVVDVTNDLGSIGPGGGGIAELNGCTGRIDVVLGSLARTFAATGGFAAVRDPDLAAALRSRSTPATALSPVGTRVIQAALDLALSP
jgi:glycine C-acetyltransferase